MNTAQKFLTQQLSRPEIQARLPMLTIYDHPSDYPNCFVARLWYTLPREEASQIVVTASTLDKLRACIPEFMTRLSRLPGDDQKIVETWL